MRCISCETEINPKWSHAINQNICPYCGAPIMEEHLKNCLTALTAAMNDMLKYPEQLNDWLLSNHNYIKTDSPNLKSFLPKEAIKELVKEVDKVDPQEKKQTTIQIKLPGGGTQEVLVEKTQSEETTNGFFDRAEAIKGSGKTSGKAVRASDEPEPPKSVIEKTKNLKSLAQQIRKEASSGITSENSMAAMMENADPDAVSEFQSVINGGDIVSSSLPDQSDGGDDEIPPAALAMARMARSGGNNSNAKDLQYLEEQKNKVANAQKKFNSGSGGFSRGG